MIIAIAASSVVSAPELESRCELEPEVVEVMPEQKRLRGLGPCWGRRRVEVEGLEEPGVPPLVELLSTSWYLLDGEDSL